MRRDPLGLYDGFSVIQSGVNSGLAAVSLGRDELSWAINTTFRNNFPTCRPGILKRQLDFSNVANPALFTDAIFQGSICFQRRNQIVAMIGGRMWSIDLTHGYEVRELVGTPGDVNNPNRYRAWFAEAEDFVIAQDGQSAPWIYNGSFIRRADSFGIFGTPEVPVGTAMAYVQGRLVVADPEGKTFVVGDIVGGPSGTATYGFRDAVLKFTENNLISQGGSFSVPINCGPIRAIQPVAQLDTSLGQGPAQVFTTGAIFSLNTPVDRSIWQTVNFPIQTTSMVSSGALSDRSTVNVNGDIWFRGFDGIRSFQVARRDFQASWVNAPMSQEMTRLLKSDDVFELFYSSAGLFENRMLMTAQPYREWGHGIVHRALGVIDFAPVAYLTGKTGPAWEGMWTGLKWLQVCPGNFAGQERLFYFVLGVGNNIELWEQSKDVDFDNNGLNDIPIVWQVESGGLTFPTNPGAVSTPSQDLVSLDGGRVFADEIRGSVSFSAAYRMDQDPCWHDWWTWSACANYQTCGLPVTLACSPPRTLQPQFRQPFRLPEPQDAFDTVTNRRLNWGRESQTKLVIQGKTRLKRFEALSHTQQEDIVNVPASESETCQFVECDCINDFVYNANVP